MKLKDIAKYCLHYTTHGDPYEGLFIWTQRYYWSINGGTYSISEIQTYGDYSDDTSFTNLVHLCRYKHWNSKEKEDKIYRKICLNLDHEVTIFNDFILVHLTSLPTDDENKLFRRIDYDSIDGYSQYYVVNLVHPNTGLRMKDLKILFKDLIGPPPVKLKQVEEKIDDLINDLMKDSKTMAIEKLKSMLNERL